MPWLSVIFETYHETYNKSTNLSQSFGNSHGNSYIPFLLLVIMLRFIERKNGKIIKNSQNIMTIVICS